MPTVHFNSKHALCLTLREFKCQHPRTLGQWEIHSLSTLCILFPRDIQTDQSLAAKACPNAVTVHSYSRLAHLTLDLLYYLLDFSFAHEEFVEGGTSQPFPSLLHWCF